MKIPTVVGVIVALILACGAWYWLSTSGGPATKGVTETPADYKTATYTIEGQPVALVDGHAETPAAPGSAETVTTDYFGNDATGDLNGDGVPDTAFIVYQNPGGTGTFFYVVVALKTATGYEGTNAILLGDRIAPQTTEIKDGELTVNYADRAATDPMTAEPSVGVSKHFKVQGTTLVETPRTVGAGERCGGNMTTAPACATGYHCAPAPGSHLPFGDVGGICVAD